MLRSQWNRNNSTVDSMFEANFQAYELNQENIMVIFGAHIGIFSLSYPFLPRMREKKTRKKMRERATREKNEKKRGKSEYFSDF